VSTGAGGKTYFHMLGGGIRPMMFTSVIVVNESFIEQPKISGNGKMFKVIDGALHAGEYERFVGAIGMIIGEQEFRGQLLMDNLSFTTAFATSGMLLPFVSCLFWLMFLSFHPGQALAVLLQNIALLPVQLGHPHIKQLLVVMTSVSFQIYYLLLIYIYRSFSTCLGCSW
jgi:hypothetical protein